MRVGQTVRATGRVTQIVAEYGSDEPLCCVEFVGAPTGTVWLRAADLQIITEPADRSGGKARRAPAEDKARRLPTATKGR